MFKMPEKGAFIHIPKNAGLSIKSMLGQLGGRVSYHSHYVNVKKLEPNVPQIVVLRDPAERFCSAIQYAFDLWSDEPHVRNLIGLSITEYNEIISAFAHPEHEHHSAICAEIRNIQGMHNIGGRPLVYRYTYTPQEKWIYRPRYVVFFENLSEELGMVWETFGGTQMNEAMENVSQRKPAELTSENIAFLRDFYKEDYVLIEKYRQLPVEVRCSGEGIQYDEDGAIPSFHLDEAN
jgi:hypothetical protein